MYRVRYRRRYRAIRQHARVSIYSSIYRLLEIDINFIKPRLGNGNVRSRCALAIVH